MPKYALCINTPSFDIEVKQGGAFFCINYNPG